MKGRRKINWSHFEAYNKLDARVRLNAQKKLGLNIRSEEIAKILAKSHFVIPGKTRYECQQCGECCRYARKVGDLTYEPCIYLTEQNTCQKHDDRYLVCKWFPFFVYDDPVYGSLLTIKPYCSGYGKGDLVDYKATVKSLKDLEHKADKDNDGAYVIHEVLYLEQLKEWAFPSRQNINTLLENVRRNSGNKFNTPENLKQTELSHAQKFTNFLLGGIQEPQVTLNEEGEITDLNEPFSKLVGKSRKELIDKRLSSLFVDSNKISQELGVCFSLGRMDAIPDRLKLKGDSSLNVLLNGVTFRSRRDGQVHGLLVSIKKVDKKVYSEIAHSRSYARGLIEASLDLLVFLDRDGMISDVNQTCCEMLAKTRDDIIGSRFTDYFTDPDLAGKGVQQCYNRGKVKNYELWLKKDDGSTLPVSFNASLYKDEFGVTQGIFAAARDISENVALIEELERSKNYTRSLIESSQDLMVTINSDGKVSDVNEAAVVMTGVSREKMLGSEFCEFFSDKTKAAGGVELTFKEGKVENYALMLRNGQATRKVIFNASLYKELDGTVGGIFATARPVK